MAMGKRTGGGSVSRHGCDAVSKRSNRQRRWLRFQAMADPV
jgi:hypothetical protein